MKIICFSLICILSFPCFFIASAAESLDIPEVSGGAANLIPENREDFGLSIKEMVMKIIPDIYADYLKSIQTGLAVYACVLLVSIVNITEAQYTPIELSGAACISIILLNTSKSMISLSVDTVSSVSEYVKLLFPAMTTAIAAQGGITSAAALYASISAFSSFLSNIITSILVPAVYAFIACAIANCAVGETRLKNIKESIQKASAWFLKTSISLFLGYLTLTGMVSGTTDKAAIKLAKATIRTAVPIIGGSLAEASDALILSIGVAKNAIGIYGVLAILALCLGPFLKIGINFLVLKGISSLCGFSGIKRLNDLIADFGSAIGLLLAITGCICVITLISIISFMKGYG